MRPRLPLVLLVLALACAPGGRSKIETLPPAPRRGVTLQTVERALAEGSIDDLLADLPDTVDGGPVFDARTMARRDLQVRQSQTAPVAAEPSTSRFRNLRTVPDSSADLGQWSMRDLPDPTPQRLVAETTDSVIFHQSWSRLVRTIGLGDAFAVRSLVWPGPARVVERYADHLRLASAWLPIERISNSELLCETQPASGDPGAQIPSVRLVADLFPSPGGEIQIKTSLGTRYAGECRTSELALDRVTAFQQDALLLLQRVVTLGTARIR